MSSAFGTKMIYFARGAIDCSLIVLGANFFDTNRDHFFDEKLEKLYNYKPIMLSSVQNEYKNIKIYLDQVLAYEINQALGFKPMIIRRNVIYDNFNEFLDSLLFDQLNDDIVIDIHKPMMMMNLPRADMRTLSLIDYQRVLKFQLFPSTISSNLPEKENNESKETNESSASQGLKDNKPNPNNPNNNHNQNNTFTNNSLILKILNLKHQRDHKLSQLDTHFEDTAYTFNNAIDLVANNRINHETAVQVELIFSIVKFGCLYGVLKSTDYVFNRFFPHVWSNPMPHELQFPLNKWTRKGNFMYMFFTCSALYMLKEYWDMSHETISENEKLQYQQTFLQAQTISMNTLLSFDTLSSISSSSSQQLSSFSSINQPMFPTFFQEFDMINPNITLGKNSAKTQLITPENLLIYDIIRPLNNYIVSIPILLQHLLKYYGLFPANVCAFLVTLAISDLDIDILHNYHDGNFKLFDILLSDVIIGQSYYTYFRSMFIPMCFMLIKRGLCSLQEISSQYLYAPWYENICYQYIARFTGRFHANGFKGFVIKEKANLQSKDVNEQKDLLDNKQPVIAITSSQIKQLFELFTSDIYSANPLLASHERKMSLDDVISFLIAFRAYIQSQYPLFKAKDPFFHPFLQRSFQSTICNMNEFYRHRMKDCVNPEQNTSVLPLPPNHYEEDSQIIYSYFVYQAMLEHYFEIDTNDKHSSTHSSGSSPSGVIYEPPTQLPANTSYPFTTTLPTFKSFMQSKHQITEQEFSEFVQYLLQYMTRFHHKQDGNSEGITFANVNINTFIEQQMHYEISSSSSSLSSNEKKEQFLDQYQSIHEKTLDKLKQYIPFFEPYFYRDYQIEILGRCQIGPKTRNKVTLAFDYYLQTYLDRSLLSHLLLQGLTPHRFKEIMNRYQVHYPELRELKEDWEAYYVSDRFKKAMYECIPYLEYKRMIYNLPSMMKPSPKLSSIPLPIFNPTGSNGQDFSLKPLINGNKFPPLSASGNEKKDVKDSNDKNDKGGSDQDGDSSFEE